MAFGVIGVLKTIVEADARPMFNTMTEVKKAITDTVAGVGDILDELDSGQGITGAIVSGLEEATGLKLREMVQNLIVNIREQFLAGLADAREFAAQMEAGTFKSITGLFDGGVVAGLRQTDQALADLNQIFLEMRAVAAAVVATGIGPLLERIVGLFSGDLMQSFLRFQLGMATTGIDLLQAPITGVETVRDQLAFASQPSPDRTPLRQSAGRAQMLQPRGEQAALMNAMINRQIYNAAQQQRQLDLERNTLLRQFVSRPTRERGPIVADAGVSD